MARAVRASSRVDAAWLVVCILIALLAIVLPSNTRAAIAASLQRTLARPLVGLQQRSERARAAFREREAMAGRMDSLARQVNELQDLSAENRNLRRLLALGNRLSRGFVPAEALHGQSAAESHSLLLTVGASAGVKANSPVIAPDGVVGRVTSVGAGTSHAILWSHPDFRVSAMSADGETFGIVGPHLAGGGGTAASCADSDESACATPERLLLELRGVPYRDALKVGDRVVSSGLGGVFPRGLPIGAVVGEIKTTEQWTRTYLLRPAVRPADVSNVMVLSPSLSGEDVNPIWSQPGALEQAVAMVVAGGDSLVQRAVTAIATEQARRDSAAAAEVRRSADSIAAPTAAPAAPAQPGTDTAAVSRPSGSTPPVIRPRPRRDSVRRP